MKDAYSFFLELNNSQIQCGLKMIENHLLVLALIDAPEAVVKRITANLSQRGARFLLEDIDAAKESRNNELAFEAAKARALEHFSNIFLSSSNRISG